MAKLILTDVGTLANPASAQQAINDNFNAIETAFENTLSRDGTLPNTMEADLDVNGNSILNVSRGSSDADATNIGHIVDLIKAQVSQPIYEDPIAYAAGLRLFKNTQLVIYNGDIYAPIASELPFTTSGTFENAKFRLIVPGMFIQSGTGAVARTMQEKGRETVSIADFGAVGNGVADDTVAITNALAAASHVIVPHGMTPLISNTITVPAGKLLEFRGSYGNPAVNPASYFIKKSTMTTPAIILNQASTMIGGGVVCQAGNTGDGLVLAGNASRALHPFVKGAGGVGIRVGTDAGDNSNCTELRAPISVQNGGHGIYIHDGAGSDCNAGSISNGRAISNGGDGIRIGHAYWVTVTNCNCENNTGWGLYLDGTNTSSYPACRWANVVGGDYNEGNAAGIVFDESYFSTFFNADGNNRPTTPANGLQGSAIRTFIGHQTSHFPSIRTGYTTSYIRSYTKGFAPLAVGTIGTASVGEGPEILFECSEDAGANYRAAAKIKSYKLGAAQDGIDFLSNNAGALTRIATISYYYNGFTPAADATFNLGHPILKWATGYFSTGVNVGTTKVIGARNTGWTAMTGTGSKGALAAAAAGTASAAYVQAELQGALNRIAALEARLKALDDALVDHGLIGA